MGKIRRTRTKRHIEAVKSNISEENTKSTNFMPNQSNLPALFPVNNLFDISQDKPQNDGASPNDLESEKIVEEKLTTKKDKRKLRHEKFLTKLHASKAVDENCKRSKKRQQTIITGDLNSLTQALLDIDKLPAIQTSKKKRKNTKKQKSRSSERKRQNAQMSDLEKFQQVIGHPLFKSNPLETIDEHVRNVIKRQTDS